MVLRLKHSAKENPKWLQISAPRRKKMTDYFFDLLGRKCFQLQKAQLGTVFSLKSKLLFEASSAKKSRSRIEHLLLASVVTGSRP